MYISLLLVCSAWILWKFLLWMHGFHTKISSPFYTTILPYLISLVTYCTNVPITLIDSASHLPLGDWMIPTHIKF